MGILIPLAFFDRNLADLVEGLTGVDIGLVFDRHCNGSDFRAVCAVFALAFGSVDSAMGGFTQYWRCGAVIGIAPRTGAGARPCADDLDIIVDRRFDGVCGQY